MAALERKVGPLAKTVKAPKPILYRHLSHADWGIGLIVEETASKIYVVFEDGGRRPFLNAQRYRELLVPAELEAEAAEEIVAKITKYASKPAAKTAEKKPKKKAVAVDSENEDAAEAVVEEDQEDDEDDE
jgi:hypothetical protein